MPFRVTLNRQSPGATSSSGDMAPSSRQLTEGNPMVEEAKLESIASGLTPVSPGWFVVNARNAAWVNNDRTGGVCIFESDD
jgi:hypothetical protein